MEPCNLFSLDLGLQGLVRPCVIQPAELWFLAVMAAVGVGYACWKGGFAVGSRLKRTRVKKFRDENLDDLG